MEKIQLCRTCGIQIPVGRKKYCDAHPSLKTADQKTKTDKKAVAGLCKSCKKPISKNSTVFCEEHLVANRKRGVRDRQRRKESGLCRSCNDPIAVNSTTWCEFHHEKQNALSRELSEKSRALELCRDCNKEPRMLRKRRCEACQKVYDDYKKTVCRRIGCEEKLTPDLKYFCRVHADEENVKLRDRREKLKEDNKCIFCFKPLSDTGTKSLHTLCINCRGKQRGQRRYAVTAVA